MTANIHDEWATGENEARRRLDDGASKADLQTLADDFENAGKSSAAEAVDLLIESLP